MEKPDYAKMMNTKEVIPVTEDIELPRGTLIGFKALGGTQGITAAYPVWSKNGRDFQFILGITETGRPIIENDFIRDGDLFINKEPIIVEVETKNPMTFQDRLGSFFP